MGNAAKAFKAHVKIDTSALLSISWLARRRERRWSAPLRTSPRVPIAWKAPDQKGAQEKTTNTEDAGKEQASDGDLLLRPAGEALATSTRSIVASTSSAIATKPCT